MSSTQEVPAVAVVAPPPAVTAAAVPSSDQEQAVAVSAEALPAGTSAAATATTDSASSSSSSSSSSSALATASATGTAPETTKGKQGPGKKEVMIELPTASIRKIVKAAIPEGTQVGKEATGAFAKAAGLFILYVTQAANAIAGTDKRSTIKGEDIIEALEELDFTELAGPLKVALENFRKIAAQKRNVAKLKAERKEDNALSPGSSSELAGSADALGSGPAQDGKDNEKEKGKGKGERGGAEDGLQTSGPEAEDAGPVRKKQKIAAREGDGK